MTEDVTAVGRERGAETVPCPNCGKELAKVTLADGAEAAESACPECYPAPNSGEKEVASAETPARETGTNVETTEENA